MEFDKKAFSNILKTLCDYCGSITNFAEKAQLDRTYISKYIHITREVPPSPKLLRKIANGSANMPQSIYMTLRATATFASTDSYTQLTLPTTTRV